MLSISVPMKGAGRGEYYLRLAQEDYYFNKGEPTGEWHGRGAERLGLSGRVDPDPFRRLLAGHSPDGKKDLVQMQNTRDRSRQSGWDLTFSAPKSVSVLYALAAERVRREIEAAQREALHAALTILQEKAGITRRGKGGKIQEPADLIFATFRHITSREQDPQLHVHALVINACVRQDGSTGAIWSKRFFELKMEAGEVFCQTLADALHRRLGLTFEWEPSGFHLTGVPSELCEIFSKRRAQIEAYLAEHNESGAVAAKKAAVSTRRKKADVNRQELFAAWRQTSDQFGWSTAHAKELVRKAEAQLAESNGREQRTDADVSQNISASQATKKADHPASESPPAHTVETPPTKSDSNSDNAGSEQKARARKRGTKTAQKGAKKRQANRKKQQRRTEGRGRRSKKQRDRASKDSSSEETSQRDGRRYRKRRTRLVRIEWTPVFPKAPHWNPLHKWRVPKIVVGRAPAPRWGKIRWRKNLWLAELRLQQRRLFPKAPGWSFAKDWSIPTLRVLPKSPMIETKKKSASEQSKSYSQSH